MDKHLHIVSLAVPYPVVHGGMFDLFYKLVALHGAGIKIHLHCFTNNPEQEPELNKYCETVHYYQRKKGLKGFSFSTPYIVSSRINSLLINNLLKDDHPILLEGIHCTWLLNDKRFRSRKTILRLHNIEYKYYWQLYKSSTSLFKKIYYYHESLLLKKYEQKIAGKPSFMLTVSKQDKLNYEQEFKAISIDFLPVFIDNLVDIVPGKGGYFIYHGNLDITENQKAVRWLVEEVFNDLNVSLLIAGRSNDNKFLSSIKVNDNIIIEANPTDTHLTLLLQNAQAHVLPSFNSTGVKLKLINALYKGRHCIVNTDAVKGSGLEELCIIVDGAERFKKAVTLLQGKPFMQNDIDKRNTILSELFNTKTNVAKLIEKL